jgi:hypothetical protein
MSKTWVLDTETKGTGANMVPIEKKLSRSGAERELALVELGGKPREAPPEAAPEPARYKVIDVLGSRVLAEDVGVREAVEALEGARSALDVSVYVWAPERNRWRLLTFEERRVLWGFRGRLPEVA